MKKFLLITDFVISVIGIWVYPYLDELIDYMDIRENAKLKVSNYLNSLTE
jgi:hypothetical protein